MTTQTTLEERRKTAAVEKNQTLSRFMEIIPQQLREASRDQCRVEFLWLFCGILFVSRVIIGRCLLLIAFGPEVNDFDLRQGSLLDSSSHF